MLLSCQCREGLNCPFNEMLILAIFDRIFGLYISGSVCLYLQRWPTRKILVSGCRKLADAGFVSQYARKKSRMLRDISN